MQKNHQYAVTTTWTGNTGAGTQHYGAYGRNHTISIENKVDILASSDPAFRGDATKHNPEEMLVSALSGCHMLWYLHLCAESGITVVAYQDRATGTMVENETGGGRFTEVLLQPTVTITNSAQIAEANALHKKANALCYIANSCNFPVRHEASCKADLRM